MKVLIYNLDGTVNRISEVHKVSPYWTDHPAIYLFESSGEAFFTSLPFVIETTESNSPDKQEDKVIGTVRLLSISGEFLHGFKVTNLVRNGVAMTYHCLGGKIVESTLPMMMEVNRE